MRYESIAEQTATLAAAYTYRQGIPRLEDELAARGVHKNLPDSLRSWVSMHALMAVAQHVNGDAVAGCPWDQDDPHPMRAALAELWWACHNTYLVDYREGRPISG